MENFILIVLLLAIGMGLRRLPVFPAETSPVLNQFVIHVSLPSVILVEVPKLVLSAEALAPVVMAWLMVVAGAGLVLVASRFMGCSREVTGALLLLVPLGNTAFLGFPMVTLFFGADHLPYAVLYDQLGSFLALSTYGSMVLALYGAGARPGVAAVLRRIFTFPPFLALILAFVARPFFVLPAVEAVLRPVAATLVPVVMIAVGVQLRLRFASSHVLPFGVGLVLKLLVAPLVATGFVSLFGWQGAAARVAVFEAGMPPMVTAGALAMAAGLAPELVAALVGYGILAAFATLPLLALFL